MQLALALPAIERVADGRMRGILGGHDLELTNRLLEIPLAPDDHPQLHAGHGQLRIELKRLLVMRLRFRIMPLEKRRHAGAKTQRGVLRVERDRFLEGRGRERQVVAFDRVPPRLLEHRDARTVLRTAVEECLPVKTCAPTRSVAPTRSAVPTGLIRPTRSYALIRARCCG